MTATGTAFSTSHIALTAVITGLLTVPLTIWLTRTRSWIDILAIALVTAASVFLFRKSANMGQLNDDGLSPFSANDWLAPILTWVFLGIYAALRPPAEPARFAQLRASVTVLSFVVNVVTI
jgi:hypothetical protein